MVSCLLPWKVVVRILLEMDLTLCRHLCTCLDISIPIPPSLFCCLVVYHFPVSVTQPCPISRRGCYQAMLLYHNNVYPCICTSCEKLMGFSMLVQCLYVCGHNKFIEGKQHFLFYILFGRLCDCVTKEVVISLMEMCDYRGHCTSLYQHSRMLDCTCI